LISHTGVAIKQRRPWPSWPADRQPNQLKYQSVQMATIDKPLVCVVAERVPGKCQIASSQRLVRHHRTTVSCIWCDGRATMNRARGSAVAKVANRTCA